MQQQQQHRRRKKTHVEKINMNSSLPSLIFVNSFAVHMKPVAPYASNTSHPVREKSPYLTPKTSHFNGRKKCASLVNMSKHTPDKNSV